jgi:hypothetical protein
MSGDPPELLISGIPRSGTSLLCRLLHEQPDCVIINEPTEIFGPLTTCENPWWIARYYRDIRREVLEGEAIENRVKDGRLVDDTRSDDLRAYHRPEVSRDDFLLGTKNTLAYLARIPVLRRALPTAPIVVCVRHPLDTIASWKGSFAHLREVDFTRFPVSYTDHALLTWRQRERLREIEDTTSLGERRALLWSYLSELVLEHRDRLLVLRYEDLVADPKGQLQRILSAVPGFSWAPVRADALKARARRELLDDEDIRAVGDLCTSQAEELGYPM